MGLPTWYYCDACGAGSETSNFFVPHPRVTKDFSSSTDMCRQFEAAIAERGLMRKYAEKLIDQYLTTYGFETYCADAMTEFWITAPPEARVDAAIALLDTLEAATK
jgi:hypothetical protein